MLPATAQDETVALQLAEHLGLALLPAGSDPVTCTQVQAALVVSGGALSVQQTGRTAPGPVAVDFGSSAMRHRRRSGHNELLGRAVGVGKKQALQVLDATAGLGRDGFVLADLGCEVTLCERNPVIVELLRAGINMATERGDPWLQAALKRMRLLPGDARHLAPDCLHNVSVIYLDPMFPQRHKSAAIKKEMAVFQMLLGNAATDQDADELLLWALQQSVARVVVKRPPSAPNLAQRPPSHCISGKAVRYDVYVRRKL